MLITMNIISYYPNLPSIEGRCGMSIGCDDERFISPKECCKATFRGWVFSTPSP